MALLGAAIVLVHNGETQNKYNILPDCVPENIKEAISCCLDCEDFLTPEMTFVGMRDLEVAVS